MANRVIINEQTAAVTTEPEIVDKDQVPVIFASSGLASGEDVVIELEVNGNWVPIVENGSAISITVANTVRRCTGPCRIRFVKPITAAPSSLIRADRYYI